MDARCRSQPIAALQQSWAMLISSQPPLTRPMIAPLNGRTVLCYGRNSLLLLTRQWMLMQLGCWCEGVRSAAGYEAVLRRRTPTIIVLCQSLSSEECDQACRLAAEHSPRSRLVVMFTHIERCVPNQAHTALPSTGGPTVFMKTMTNLLGK